jgi:23S rRNA (pseudouridine1915-N3)-methyltransferase
MDWAARATSTGRGQGLGPVEIIEVEGRKPGKASEAEALNSRLEDSYIIACDEHGSALSSRRLAEVLTRLKDDGVARVAFVVGGADGLDEAVLSRADLKIAFGPQTWPHALVRAMLAEQVYRAATLLAGTPYHRD